MYKVSVWLGIGILLVTALNYGLPMEQNAWRLVPALVGAAIAAVGLVGLRGEKVSETLRIANMISCILLVIYSSLQVIPAVLMSGTDGVEYAANLSLILSAVIYILVTANELQEGPQRVS